MVETIKETQQISPQNARIYHHELRQFLCMALRELNLMITDQPGLLGPKALFVFMGLSMARDEINWLLRHQFYHLNQAKPTKQAKGEKNKDVWMDK